MSNWNIKLILHNFLKKKNQIHKPHIPQQWKGYKFLKIFFQIDTIDMFEIWIYVWSQIHRKVIEKAVYCLPLCYILTLCGLEQK